MERKFLEGIGLDKDTVEKIMIENGKDIEKQKGMTTAAEADRDAYKQQLEGVADKLKAFEGVDIDNLKGEIEALKGDIAKKEADFNLQLADRDFISTLNAEILSAKGKNPKAVMGLLDTEALKSSKNQKEDIAAAIKKLSESDAYLFDGEIARQTPIKIKTGGDHNEGDLEPSDANSTMNSFIRSTVKGE